MSKRRNQYIKDRNILRNNIKRSVSKFLPVGNFYVTCLLQRFKRNNKIIFN